jgi:hypothetical protein
MPAAIRARLRLCSSSLFPYLLFRLYSCRGAGQHGCSGEDSELLASRSMPRLELHGISQAVQEACMSRGRCAAAALVGVCRQGLW